MFQSPAVRVYTSENADNLVQRKPGSHNSAVRKPFVDKSVNTKTLDIAKLKPKVEPTKETKVPEKQSFQDDLDASEFMFSYKDTDRMQEDSNPYFNKEDIIHILRSYAGDFETPPPSPSFERNKKFDPMFLNLPHLEYAEQTSLNLFEEKFLLDEDLNVEIPSYDSDEFDESMY